MSGQQGHGEADAMPFGGEAVSDGLVSGRSVTAGSQPGGEPGEGSKGAVGKATGETVLEAVVAPLFVPATRPERFAKALTSGADAVIIDLEDAVASAEKGTARQILREQVPGLGGADAPLGVRVNGAATEHLTEDAALVAALADDLDFLVLPEVQGPQDVGRLQELLGASTHERTAEPRAVETLPLLALVESSAGLLNAPAVAQLPAVRRLALGAADLSEEWEIEPSPEEREFDVARQHLVIASRAAGLNGPIDSPHMNVRDAGGLSRRTAAAAGLGVKGKLCIHPSQVAAVQEAFLVSAEEHQRLQELIRVFEQAESAGDSSVRMPDGGFVDYPVYRRAVKQVAAYEGRRSR